MVFRSKMCNKKMPPHVIFIVNDFCNTMKPVYATLRKIVINGHFSWNQNVGGSPKAFSMETFVNDCPKNCINIEKLLFK